MQATAIFSTASHRTTLGRGAATPGLLVTRHSKFTSMKPFASPIGASAPSLSCRPPATPLAIFANNTWAKLPHGIQTAAVLAGPRAAWAGRSGGRVGSSGRSYSSPSSSYSIIRKPRTSMYASPLSSVTLVPSISVPAGPQPVYELAAAGPAAAYVLPALLIFMVAWLLITWPTTSIDAGRAGAASKASVIKVQVAMLSSACRLQQDLEDVAAQASTVYSSGLHSLLRESMVVLMHNLEYCAYASCSSKVVKGTSNAEATLDQMSLAERSKFAEVVVSNISKTKWRRPTRDPAALAASGNCANELVVVTLLLSCKGEVKMPQIRSAADFKDALLKLGGISRQDVDAVEILWAPKDDKKYLTRTQVLADYPDLVLL